MARTIASRAGGRTNRRFLLIALLLSGLSAALLYAALSSKSSDGGAGGGGGTTTVVVAKAPIGASAVIDASMLTTSKVDGDDLILGAFINPEDAVGKITKYPIEANQQIIASAVIDKAAPGAESALAIVVPTGKRAMSIEASQVGNAGGLILPGDYVDLVWTCCDRPVLSKTIARNIQVAAVAQAIGVGAAGTEPGENPVKAGDPEPNPEAVTITLLVTPVEAQQIFLAESFGKIRADLRSVGDADTSDSGVTLITDAALLPIEAVAALPDELKPEGYKPAGGR